ncbi:MAG: TrmH family RNA methyltransferase, partial [Pseudomonadota bacterium]
TRHADWSQFEVWRIEQRLPLTLLTTKTSEPYTSSSLSIPQVLLFGSESSGVPEKVHNLADQRITIPMQPEARSLNLAVSVGIIAAEAIRQSHA